MAKQKYMKPSVVVVTALEKEGILAGSKDWEADGPGSGESKGDEGSRSKHFSFNAWDTWDDDC